LRNLATREIAAVTTKLSGGFIYGVDLLMQSRVPVRAAKRHHFLMHRNNRKSDNQCHQKTAAAAVVG
jgi:hypothetical protein